ncbi:hypothetical protein Mal4_52710 [Maioricimonas rarisocia]|uniref:Uncharacterized protein n=1 Tax=Maioricimonas rarisocia TaxID=2528026 RepID=A0A517ZEL9_9PLAN|nr:hypothetical protein [Maioricimonas rarisocia]QDU40908.1 hypothetical protein Mal4_52710 [Maioricimonas rarisocia]
MPRIPFTGLLLSFSLLLTASSSLRADDARPQINSGARPLTQAEGVREWSGSIDDLELQTLDRGFIASGKKWIQLWNAWRFADERPDVDFTKKLAIISTTRGGRITLDTMLDDQGNLHVSGIETRDLRPGFRYAIQIVDREGVRTVSGKPVPEVRDMVQQPVRPVGPDVDETPFTAAVPSVTPTRNTNYPGPVRINVTFGTEAEEGRRSGVIDAPEDVWNLIDYAQPELKAVQLADGSASDVRITVSDNDGEWGIEGPAGAYHAYIYHNCRCVDLTAKFEYLPPGIYDLYVFAHGDAPDQNAAIEVESAGVVTTGKATLNDGTWDFRSRKFRDGNQYVKYSVEVKAGHPLVITSRRDGSVYAMLNAIQLERVVPRD